MLTWSRHHPGSRRGRHKPGWAPIPPPLTRLQCWQPTPARERQRSGRKSSRKLARAYQREIWGGTRFVRFCASKPLCATATAAAADYLLPVRRPAAGLRPRHLGLRHHGGGSLPPHGMVSTTSHRRRRLHTCLLPRSTKKATQNAVATSTFCPTQSALANFCRNLLLLPRRC